MTNSANMKIHAYRKFETLIFNVLNIDISIQNLVKIYNIVLY